MEAWVQIVVAISREFVSASDQKHGGRFFMMMMMMMILIYLIFEKSGLFLRYAQFLFGI